MGASYHVSILIYMPFLPESSVFELVNSNYHKGNNEMICLDLSLVNWKHKEFLSINGR